MCCSSSTTSSDSLRPDQRWALNREPDGPILARGSFRKIPKGGGGGKNTAEDILGWHAYGGSVQF